MHLRLRKYIHISIPHVKFEIIIESALTVQNEKKIYNHILLIEIQSKSNITTTLLVGDKTRKPTPNNTLCEPYQTYL